MGKNIHNIKMALSSSLATRCNLLSVSKGFRWIHATSSVGALSKNEPLAQSDAGYLKEGFWDKNKRLARPMSPHLTIYKPQMTTILSITHRGTGLTQSAILTGFAVFGMASNYSYPWVLSQVAQFSFMGQPLFFWENLLLHGLLCIIFSMDVDIWHGTWVMDLVCQNYTKPDTLFWHFRLFLDLFWLYCNGKFDFMNNKKETIIHMNFQTAKKKKKKKKKIFKTEKKKKKKKKK